MTVALALPRHDAAGLDLDLHLGRAGLLTVRAPNCRLAVRRTARRGGVHGRRRRAAGVGKGTLYRHFGETRTHTVLHGRILLTEAAPRLDAEYLAHALLAPLSPRLYGYQRHQLGITAERIEAGVCRLTRGLLSTAAQDTC